MISARYEKGSVIITSNKGVGEWGEYLSDPTLAAAILDRFLHLCHVVNIKGDSYRLREQSKTKAKRAGQAKKCRLLTLLPTILNRRFWYILIPPLTTRQKANECH